MKLYQILFCLRSLSMYYQSAHWQCKNTVFYGDHLLFERLYGSAEGKVDTVAEKLIGVNEGADKVSAPFMIKGVYEKIKSLPFNASENSIYFKSVLKLEEELQDACKQYDAAQENSLGARNLVADIADEGQGRIYLVKQRINSSSNIAVDPILKV